MVKKLNLSSKPIVELVNVSKVYQLDGVKIEPVKNISLKISQGELVAIIGPSGSGKSTLMYLMGLLDKATKGEVRIEERQTNKLSENELANLRNQKIGFVFQQFNLLPRTSAIDNVILPLQYSKAPSLQRREIAKNFLEKVGLGHRLKNFPSQLSGGEQQRVAIARALVCNPVLILADEPTGNLDTKSGKQILEILTQLNSEGKTVVIVTHDAAIAKVAKRIITLSDGKIISDVFKN